MAHVINILARGSDDGWGGLIIAAIVLIGWVVKAVSEAVKQATKQQPPRRTNIIVPPPPLPRGNVAAARRGNKKAKIGIPPRIAAPPLPPPPVVQEAIAPPPARRQLSPTARRPASKNQRALQNRIVWAEVLGKPLALREEGDG